MNQQYKRKIFFIQKDFQGRMILQYFLFAVAGYALLALILLFFSADTITISYGNNDVQLGQTPIMLLNEIMAANWVLLLLGGALLVYTAIRLTHRIAGPQYKLEQTVRSMCDGDLTNIVYLRQKDESRELAQNLNQFNKSLSEHVKTIEKRSQLITAQLSYLQVEIDNSHNQQLIEIENVIAEQNGKIQEICKSFTTL